jgi:hypothetical protein
MLGGRNVRIQDLSRFAEVENPLNQELLTLRPRRLRRAISDPGSTEIPEDPIIESSDYCVKSNRATANRLPDGKTAKSSPKNREILTGVGHFDISRIVET